MTSLGTTVDFGTELRYHLSLNRLIQGIHPDPCVWCSLLSHLDEGGRGIGEAGS